MGRESQWQTDSWFSSLWRDFSEFKMYQGSWLQLLKSPKNFSVTICDHNEEVLSFCQKLAEEENYQDRLACLSTDSFLQIQDHGQDFDLVFCDPAYSLKDGLGDDWDKVIDLIKSLERQKVPYLIWYPLYGPRKPNKVIEETECSAIELHWPTTRKSAYVPKGCGLFMNENLISGIDRDRGLSFASLLGGQVMVKTRDFLPNHHLFGDLGPFSPTT